MTEDYTEDYFAYFNQLDAPPRFEMYCYSSRAAVIWVFLQSLASSVL
jgi:hypothetical protein